MSKHIDLYDIENICFEGGGILGIAYIGALERLHQLDLLKNIKRYSGSSVGAICASALACGCTFQCLKSFFEELDPSSLKDGGNIFKMMYRLFKRNGLYKGDQLYKSMGDLLVKSCGNRYITFKESYEKYGKYLIINGTSLNQQKTVYYSKDHSPNMKILDAVRISTCYPFIFQDVRLKGDVLIDGGFLDNYPIHVFDGKEFGGNPDFNAKTIGLRLMNSDEINKKFKKVTYIINFIPAIINSIYTQAINVNIDINDKNRTVIIDIGNISSMDFNIDNEERDFLIKQGYDGVNNFYDCQCSYILKKKHKFRKRVKRKRRRKNVNEKVVKVI